MDTKPKKIYKFIEESIKMKKAPLKLLPLETNGFDGEEYHEKSLSISKMEQKDNFLKTDLKLYHICNML